MRAGSGRAATASPPAIYLDTTEHGRRPPSDGSRASRWGPRDGHNRRDGGTGTRARSHPYRDHSRGNSLISRDSETGTRAGAHHARNRNSPIGPGLILPGVAQGPLHAPNGLQTGLGLGPSPATGTNITGERSQVTPLHNQLNIPETNTMAQQFEGGIGSLAPQFAPLPLDYAVSDALRARIWAREYIDFGDLLHPLRQSQMAISVRKVDDGKSELCLVSQSKKLPKTIGDWQSAFAIYVSVYTVKYPQETGPLLKYSETVRRVAAKGAGNFNLYDATYRQLRQTLPHIYPWDHYHGELFTNATEGEARPSGEAKPKAAGQASAKMTQFPKGYCFRWHSGQPCENTPCPYTHSCFRCHRTHPIFRCWGKDGKNDDREHMPTPRGESRGDYRWESSHRGESSWEPRGGQGGHNRGDFQFGGPPRYSQRGPGRGSFAHPNRC